MKIVSPSLLAADFCNLGRDVKMLEESSAKWIHFDVMDGVFVPNISFGIPVLESVRKNTSLFLDVHLMITEPEKYIQQFSRAGADLITFHVEATSKTEQIIKEIHSLGKKAGISIKPNTDIDTILPFLKDIDLVLIMSVEPGFGGQKFIESTLQKTAELDRIRKEKGFNFLLEMDGGISFDNAGNVFGSGCDVIVAGSAVFKAADPVREISKILEA